jgi:hypothetical protein
MWRILVVSSILFTLTMHGQILHGTAVDVLLTDTDAIVAMDTLLKGNNTGGFYHDVCKLTQHGNILMALSGVEAVNRIFLPGIATFDSQFAKVSSQQELEQAVNAWSESVKKLLEERLQETGWNYMQKLTTDGQFTEAEFFATDSSGKQINFRVGFMLGSVPPYIYVVHDTIRLDSGPATFRTYAKGKLVEIELRENKTERASKNQKILQDLKSARTVEEKKKALNELVELAATWLPDDIGTPVDIARVSGGHVEWLQRTHSCFPIPGMK